MDEGRKMMKKLILKGTDLELSNVCLGTANFGEKLTKEQAYEVLDTYVAAGGNLLILPMYIVNGLKNLVIAVNSILGVGCGIERLIIRLSSLPREVITILKHRKSPE